MLLLPYAYAACGLARLPVRQWNDPERVICSIASGFYLVAAKQEYKLWLIDGWLARGRKFYFAWASIGQSKTSFGERSHRTFRVEESANLQQRISSSVWCRHNFVMKQKAARVSPIWSLLTFSTENAITIRYYAFQPYQQASIMPYLERPHASHVENRRYNFTHCAKHYPHQETANFVCTVRNQWFNYFLKLLGIF